MSTVDQGLDLSPEKLFRFENEKLARRGPHAWMTPEFGGAQDGLGSRGELPRGTELSAMVP